MAPKMQSWSEEKEKKLTLVWVTVLENPYSRTSRDFWAKVGNIFHNLIGCRSRNLDAICSKFRFMRTTCREFNGLYNHVINNTHEDDLVGRCGHTSI